MNSSIAIFSSSPVGPEDQTRFLMSRIDALEKSLLDIHSAISSYSTKIAKTRDIGDVLAQTLLNFSEFEKVDTSLKQGLTNFANCFNTIQDFRDDQVKQIDEKVMNELSIYGELSKRAREELKLNSSARDKQILALHRNDSKDLVRSNSFNEIPNAMTAYELQVQKFEMKKICDIKKTFLELTKSELLFHSKTIEMLTKAYNHLLLIDADKDLQDFCTFMRFTNLGSPKRDESMKSSTEEINQTTLRRFNSVPAINSSVSSIEDQNDSKSIETIAQHLGNENFFESRKK